MSKKLKGLEHTYQVRLYPTPEQGRLLMSHCQEYISTVNVLVHVCPACTHKNKAQDRTYVCEECGWYGHRDMVGSVNISRRTGLVGQR